MVQDSFDFVRRPRASLKRGLHQHWSGATTMKSDSQWRLLHWIKHSVIPLHKRNSFPPSTSPHKTAGGRVCDNVASTVAPASVPWKATPSRKDTNRFCLFLVFWPWNFPFFGIYISFQCVRRRKEMKRPEHMTFFRLVHLDRSQMLIINGGF